MQHCTHLQQLVHDVAHLLQRYVCREFQLWARLVALVQSNAR